MSETKSSDGSNARYLVYLVALFIFNWIFEWLLIGIFTIIEGGYKNLFAQMLGMCGNAWWGGMDMSNYFLQPSISDECDSITTTVAIGTPVTLVLASYVLIILRNWIFDVPQTKGHYIRTLLYWLAVVGVVTTCRYFAGFSPKNPYMWWPDGVVLGVATFVFAAVNYNSRD